MIKIVNIPESKMAVYRATALRRQAERAERLQRRFAFAWQVARRGAEALKGEFGVDKVMVFGSLLRPELFHERSDIDLAIWSINDGQYFRAAAHMLDLDTEFLVDLVELESAPPALYEAIIQEHKLI